MDVPTSNGMYTMNFVFDIIAVGGSVGDSAMWNMTDGIFSISGTQNDQTYARMHVTVPLTGTLQLKLRVSSEAGWDFARVYTDSNTASDFYDPQDTNVMNRPIGARYSFSLSGNHESDITIPVTKGQFVAITYEKDWAVSEGDDTLFVSDLQFIASNVSKYKVGDADSVPSIEILSDNVVVKKVDFPYNSFDLNAVEFPQQSTKELRIQDQLFQSGQIIISQNSMPILSESTLVANAVIGGGFSEKIINRVALEHI